VVLVTNNFPPVRGGSAVVYANLARCAGGRIVVVAPRIGYADGLPFIGWREHDRHAPYRVIRLPLLRTRLLEQVPRGLARLTFLLGDAVIRLRLAAVLMWLAAAHGVRTVCIGELSASGWLLPLLRVVIYVHGEEITTADAYDPNHAIARRSLLASDAVVVVSRFTEAAVRGLVGRAGADRVCLIENGVDGTRFRPARKSPELLALYGLEGSFVFISVCRLLEKKGIDNTIRALARLPAASAGCRYLIVGGGPYRARLEALAAELGVQERVVFAGQVADDELVDHYRLGDVFVMPNRALPNGDTEGFGLVFLEANACGLPAIAGRDGGSPHAVQDGVNGLLVDGASVDAIAAAMTRLLEDGALRDRLRELGLEVAAKAGWGMKTQRFLNLCDQTSGKEGLLF
jgi:phosphatidylinositol alpha-1,6-mannosyltransferase